MAQWSGNKVDPMNINNGEEYDPQKDRVSVDAFNSIVNNSIYASNTSDEAMRIAGNAQATTNNGVSYNPQTPTVREQAQAILNLNIYPVGSIYITTNAEIDPAEMFGGDWEKLTEDAYFKIVTQNAGEPDGTDQTHHIPITSMPLHSHALGTTEGFWAYGHSQNMLQSGSGVWGYQLNSNSTQNSGGNQPYYPYYYGVYAWHRYN